MLFRKKTRGWLLLAVMGFIVFSAPAARAAEIVALINDELISRKDVDKFLQLILFESGLANTRGARERFYSNAVGRAFEHKLKKSEFGTNNLSPGDIDQGIKNLAQQLNVSQSRLNDLLSTRNILNLVRERIAVEEGWRRLIRARYRNDLIISDQDVRAEAANLLRDAEKEKVNIDIITLDAPGGDKRLLRRRAQALIGDVKRGADFSRLARVFSQSPSAQKGGALGWVTIDRLSPEFNEAVQRLKPGQIVSTPVRTPEGFSIIRLNARRPGNPAAQNRLILAQLVFETSEAAEKTRRGVMNCEQRLALGEKNEALQGRILDPLISDQLAPDLRETILALDEGTAAGPFPNNEGFYILSLCAVRQAELQETQYESIRNKLWIERFENHSRLHLRELWFDAVIEIKDPALTPLIPEQI